MRRDRRPWVSLLLFTGVIACSAAAIGEEPARPAPKDRPVGAGPNDRAYLGLETEVRPGGEPGVFVAYIHPLSPAKEMGFQVGDELRAVLVHPSQHVLARRIDERHAAQVHAMLCSLRAGPHAAPALLQLCDPRAFQPAFQPKRHNPRLVVGRDSQHRQLLR